MVVLQAREIASSYDELKRSGDTRGNNSDLGILAVQGIGLSQYPIPTRHPTRYAQGVPSASHLTPNDGTSSNACQTGESGSG
ncbi:hypothetical protein BC936DRAFT_149413 [Jimgerdemannia flammicorona]|nr:hypothetical protein BC936DRAFT_149413 [Jimgerdemannia flammicorona]